MNLYTHTLNSALRNMWMGRSLGCRDSSGYKTACVIELLFISVSARQIHYNLTQISYLSIPFSLHYFL